MCLHILQHKQSLMPACLHCWCSGVHAQPCLRSRNKMPCISVGSWVCNMCLYLLKHMARGCTIAAFANLYLSFEEQKNAATMQANIHMQQHNTTALNNCKSCSSIHGRAQRTEAYSTKADQAVGKSRANEVQASARSSECSCCRRSVVQLTDGIF